MIRFQHPEYLWFLVLVPALALLYVLFISWRRSRIKKLGNPELVKNMIIGKINGRLTTRVVLGGMAMVCCVLALANPQAGGKAEKTQRKGIDILFALDLSESMLAQDVSPDRLSRAKQLIYRSLDQMQNDRVGLVLFAGNAYLQAPLTIDYNAVKLLLSGADPGMIPTQGTVLGDAISLANESFSKKEQKHKVLVILSDGEDHDEAAVSATREAADDGVVVYTIGIGSPQGTTLSDPETGTLKRDPQGGIVVSKLNENALKAVAQAGNGSYRLLTNINRESQWLLGEIAQMETKNLGTVVYRDYKSYFPWFLVAGIILLLIEFLIPTGKVFQKELHPGRRAGMVPFWITLLMCSAYGASAQSGTGNPRKALREGNRLYKEQNYSAAERAFQSAADRQPRSYTSWFNLGDAQYQSGKTDAARQQFLKSLEQAPDNQARANAHYNVGNTYMKEQKWAEAASAFKSALRLNPQDEDARYNLAYAQAMLKKEQSREGSQKQQQDKDQEDKQQQDDPRQQDQQSEQNDKEDRKENQPRPGDQQEEEPKQKQEQGEDKGRQDEAQRHPQPQPSRLSQKEAENILNALNQEERKLHNRKEKAPASPVRPEKDW